MALYDYGGIFDYLEAIHFPDRGGKIPPGSGQPWYYFLEQQLPMYFSYLGGVWGPGWAVRPILPVIKILAVDTQPMTPTETVGFTSLEAAADRYVERWDQGNPLATEAFGRINPKDKFWWRTTGRKFPKWAKGWNTGLLTNKPHEQPIGPYVEKQVVDYFTRWNESSLAYNAAAAAIPASGAGWNPLVTHSFEVPYPRPTSWEGGNFSLLQKQLSQGTAWFGPLPTTAWTRFFIILTQAYCFTYGYGQLDPFEWDLSHWPPRRTSIPQVDGGSKRAPSAITGQWQGFFPYANFPDHVFDLM